MVILLEVVVLEFVIKAERHRALQRVVILNCGLKSWLRSHNNHGLEPVVINSLGIMGFSPTRLTSRIK